VTRDIPDHHSQTGMTAPVSFDKVVIISARFVTIYTCPRNIESGQGRVFLRQKTLLHLVGKSQGVAHVHMLFDLGDDLVEGLYDQVPFIIKASGQPCREVALSQPLKSINDRH